MVELSLDVFMFYFNVREGCQTAGAPVDQPLSTVDQSIFMQPYEDFEDGLRQPLVHGKSQSVPVAGFAELFLLVDDRVAGGGFPLPHSFDETLPPQRFS